MAFIFGWGSKNPTQLLAQLQKQPTEKWKAEIDALTYLASHSNPQLEEAMKNRLTEANISSLTSQLLKTSPQLLDTCLKVVKLEALETLSKNKNIQEHAQREASIRAKPAPISFRSRVFSNLTFQPGNTTKVVTYVVLLLSWIYSIDFDNPPKNSWMAQNQWMFFRSMVTDIIWVSETIHSYFGSVKKTAAVGFAIIGIIAGLKILYNRYNLDDAPLLNKDYFTEICPLQNHRSVGYKTEIKRILSNICVPSGIDPNIPILVGDPGVGKTHVMTELATKIANGEIPRLKGMRVFSVNASDLSEHGGWSDGGKYRTRLEDLLRDLEGKEGKIILFMDEIHNAAKSKDNAGTSVLESLKTKLQARKIRAVFATTIDEYETYIKPNGAIVDRTDYIPFNGLDDPITSKILKKRFVRGETSHLVKASSVQEVITQGSAMEGKKNPRKSIQIMTRAVSNVYNWLPEKLATEMEDLSFEIDELKEQITRIADKNPYWDDNAENLATHKRLKEKQDLLLKKNEAVKEQASLHQQFVDFKDLQKLYIEKRNALAHQITDSKVQLAPSEKEYRWIQFVILPALKMLVKENKKTFASKFQEEIPEKVTGDVVRSLFPVNGNSV